jgi:hypothetical protein
LRRRAILLSGEGPCSTSSDALWRLRHRKESAVRADRQDLPGVGRERRCDAGVGRIFPTREDFGRSTTNQRRASCCEEDLLPAASSEFAALRARFVCGIVQRWHKGKQKGDGGCGVMECLIVVAVPDREKEFDELKSGNAVRLVKGRCGGAGGPPSGSPWDMLRKWIRETSEYPVDQTELYQLRSFKNGLQIILQSHLQNFDNPFPTVSWNRLLYDEQFWLPEVWKLQLQISTNVFLVQFGFPDISEN